MDPVTAGALVAAVNAAVSGAGGEAGRRALESFGTLVRRVLRRGEGEPAGGPDPEPVAIPYDDDARLRQLADLLVERARRDPEFGRDLAAWMREHGEPAGQAGTVNNRIGGNARITGPVVQARDINGPISFG
ncbi:hypothetical protein [Streptomyces rapamycinicus]|uniref:Uncharacterized protein n=2 Tax=Streptomyces rapamycinicus TaxID=1226757 RepID=A0A0A0NK21_STRRN|nr:hypothetical protein [Streptomyces rapamycinicus]AGP57546.1 hypothetical protein M271_30560 [Streptomyces rapamycinicus NRRL 5491]MBB4785206.1 hypothetical protein [Streptomyces rapamycinicus]RLV79322.1 hypothetical protein D3C57_113095 [Streptomyces rapamycinicus NRRL 5491]UTO65416.1 hypothetical protein LJB45_25910 [Streptomyces rapamycinicus]UTP33372.1 hypothetical protein LIV37_31040 [Streptomyces rapamycinicus NRRL 5491]